ncbi:NAD(P)/FAD-dependent oxidoreductase [Ectobacillus ponti]|nr:FAD-dependent oxidoreductase [Ectobacillus ponti]
MQSYIVVGAGILGASAAYHLARSGARVTVVDRQDAGRATDAAAGIICPWLSQRRNKDWYTLAKNGARYYSTLVAQLEEDGETDTGYKRAGAICLHTEEKLEQLEERARLRRKDAPEIGKILRLSPSETKALFPPLSEQYGSVYISGAARVNGAALRLAMIHASQKHGATVLQGDAELIYENNRVTGVTVAGSILQADQVLVTVGAWVNELLRPLGILFRGTFQKAQIVHLQLPEAGTDNWPVVMPPNDQYILAFENGRIVTGATHENETGFDTRVTAGGLHEVFDKALAIAPGLADAAVLETRVGFRPFTPGFLPVIGRLPHYEGLLIANGLGASGLTAGPYLGAELAKLALGEPTELDVSRYDPVQACSE